MFTFRYYSIHYFITKCILNHAIFAQLNVYIMLFCVLFRLQSLSGCSQTGSIIKLYISINKAINTDIDQYEKNHCDHILCLITQLQFFLFHGLKTRNNDNCFLSTIRWRHSGQCCLAEAEQCMLIMIKWERKACCILILGFGQKIIHEVRKEILCNRPLETFFEIGLLEVCSSREPSVL